VDRWSTKKRNLVSGESIRFKHRGVRKEFWETERAHMDECLETPKQLAKRVGLTEGKIRHLINTGQIEHVWIGSRVHVPKGAFGRFIEAKKVTPCQDEIKVPVSVGSKSATATTSSGPNMVAAASAALARQTANRLKSSSPNGSKSEGGGTAQVIPPQCS
jgi:excisionase family DNA binding protein